MLEPLYTGGKPLAADAEASGGLVAAAELPGGTLAVARCPESDRGGPQHMELYLVHRTGSSARGATVETVKARSEIASYGVWATAMAWLPFAGVPGVREHQHLLCVGFSHGGVSLFTPKGAVCLSFLLVAKPVLRVRLSLGAGASAEGEAAGAQLLLLHDGGVLAVVTLESLAEEAFGTGDESQGYGSTEGGLLLQVARNTEVYELRGRADIVDVCMLEQAEPLEDVFATSPSTVVVALGTKPFLSLHRALAGAKSSRSLLGAAASAFTSYAKSWLPLRKTEAPALDPLNRAAGTMRPADLQVALQASAEELPVAAKFIDPTRVGDNLEIAPRCSSASLSLAATCDTFGRVGLFCVETLRCLRLWKGYRDAQVAWLRGAKEHQLGLVIYAPRRGLLELWDVGFAGGCRRVDAAAVDMDCRLLACSGQVHLIRPSGQIDKVRWCQMVRPDSSGSAHGRGPAASEADSEVFGSAAGSDCEEERAVEDPEPRGSPEPDGAVAPAAAPPVFRGEASPPSFEPPARVGPPTEPSAEEGRMASG